MSMIIKKVKKDCFIGMTKNKRLYCLIKEEDGFREHDKHYSWFFKHLTQDEKDETS